MKHRSTRNGFSKVAGNPTMRSVCMPGSCHSTVLRSTSKINTYFFKELADSHLTCGVAGESDQVATLFY